MTIGLTVLLGLLSAGILVGRVYEILKLTDAATGFFLYKGIVFNPYILIIFIIVTVCCGILIFGSCKSEQPFFSQSSKLIAVAAGVMFLIYGVMAFNSSAAAPFVIAGGIAFVIVGTFEFKANADIADIAAVILTTAFIVGLCLDVIIFNVSTIQNIDFTKNALSYIALALFMLFVMKNVYRPAASAKMLLFITSIAAFVFCGVMHIADIIAMAINGHAVLPDLFFHAGFGFVGFFAFDNAISVMTKKVQQGTLKTDMNEHVQTAAAYKAAEHTDATVFEVKAKETDDTQSFQEQPDYNDMMNFFKNTSAEEVETEEKSTVRTVFTRGGQNKKAASPKENGKVVYKKPKN